MGTNKNQQQQTLSAKANTFLTPPVAGALFLAALVASCLRGALPPVDLRAVCFVRAIVAAAKVWVSRREGRRLRMWAKCSTDSTAEFLKAVLCRDVSWAILTEPPCHSRPLPSSVAFISQQLCCQTPLAQATSSFLAFRFLTYPPPLRVMAPKMAAAEKKPAPAKKAVAKKSTGSRKKGSKKAVESYKIYIYKVCQAKALQMLGVNLVFTPGWSM